MPDFPAPTGDVTYRLWSDFDDLAGIVEVLNASSRHDGVERHETLETTGNMYRNLTNCDLDTDLILAERDGSIVGYRRAFWYLVEKTDERMLTHVGWTDPAVRSLGVGAALVAWCEARLAEIAVEQPHDGPQAYMAWCDEREVSAMSDLQQAGYELVETYAEMTRPLAGPIEPHSLPDGVEIRPVTSADMRAVWEADDEAFRDHVGHSPGSESDFQQFVDDPNADPSLWKVAFAGGVIVGQVLNFINEEEDREFGRRRGWTESISTRRDWRGRGIARALITESIRMFQEMEMEDVALGVHTTNPTGAFQLYEGLGYRIVAKQFEYRKELAP